MKAPAAQARAGAAEVRYTPAMEAKDLRAFVERAWDLKDEAKRRYWIGRYAEEGPCATLAASNALREHLRTLRPAWPTPEDRADDLRRHLELVALLRSVARVFVDR